MNIQEKKTETMSNTDLIIKMRWTRVLAKGRQILLLIRRMSCYSYIQSSPVKVLNVIEERKHLR